MKLISYDRLLSELRLNVALKDLSLDGYLNEATDNSEDRDFLESQQHSNFVDLSEVKIDLYGILEGSVFDGSVIIFHHPISDEQAKILKAKEKSRPFIIVSDDELITESWTPTLSRYHKEIRFLPVQNRVTCKLEPISLLTLLTKNEFTVHKVALDRDEDFYRKLKSPTQLPRTNALLPESNVHVISSALWESALYHFKEDRKKSSNLQFKPWLETKLKSNSTRCDPFLGLFVEWSVSNNKFPLLEDLKSVFKTVYSSSSVVDARLGLGDDDEDLRYTLPVPLNKANERASKIYMSNFVRHCFIKHLLPSRNL